MVATCEHGRLAGCCEECNEWVYCATCDGEEGWPKDGDWEICPGCEGEGMWLVKRNAVGKDGGT